MLKKAKFSHRKRYSERKSKEVSEILERRPSLARSLNRELEMGGSPKELLEKVRKDERKRRRISPELVKEEEEQLAMRQLRNQKLYEEEMAESDEQERALKRARRMQVPTWEFTEDGDMVRLV